MASPQLNRAPVAYPLFAAVKDLRRPHEHFQIGTSALECVADLVTVMAAVLLAYFAYRHPGIGRQVHYSIGILLTIALLFATAFVASLGRDGAYERANSLLRIRETERILRVTTQVFTLVFPVTFFFSFMFSRSIVALAAVLVPLLLVIEKQLVFLLIRLMHSRGHGLQNVLVYGAGSTGRQVFSALVRSPKVGLNPVAFIDDDETLSGTNVYEYGYKRERSAPVIAGPLTDDLIRAHGVSLIVVGIPSITTLRLKKIATEAFIAGASVAFVPQLSFEDEAATDYVDIDGVLIASLGRSTRKRMYETAKRMIDFCVSSLLLLFTAPLWAAFALLIHWDSTGPVFFRQLRVGRGGKLFEMYKFRTMRVNAPKYGLHPTGVSDPRITRVGRWLRRTSLDELPQLINVLKGDMSLVGPRPEMPFIVDGYNGRHWERLSVIPGLTGLWQLSADRSFLIHENIQYDLYYIRNRNFFMDLAILLHTAVFAMKGI